MRIKIFPLKDSTRKILFPLEYTIFNNFGCFLFHNLATDAVFKWIIMIDYT